MYGRPVASRIPELVAEKGWSTQQFADKADLHYPTAWKLCRGDIPDSLTKTIIPSANALGVRIQNLFQWEE